MAKEGTSHFSQSAGQTEPASEHFWTGKHIA